MEAVCSPLKKSLTQDANNGTGTTKSAKPAHSALYSTPTETAPLSPTNAKPITPLMDSAPVATKATNSPRLLAQITRLLQSAACLHHPTTLDPRTWAAKFGTGTIIPVASARKTGTSMLTNTALRYHPIAHQAMLPLASA